MPLTKRSVITSYSIHYTKLYDHLFTGCLCVGTVVGGEVRVMDNFVGNADWYQTIGSEITLNTVISDQDIGMTYDDHSALST